MKKTLQARPLASELADRERHGADLLADLLTTVEAAERLKFRGPSAEKNFLKWADRWRVPRLKRGRICLWRPSVLVAFLERAAWTRNRHEGQSGSVAAFRKGDGLSR